MELDAELAAVDERIRVRATGGFALLWYGLRDEGTTVDIDTITDTYPPQVRDAINRVAVRFHLERDWINNQAVGASVADTLDMLDAVFVAQDTGFGRIELAIADVPTLTRAKAIAVDVDTLSGRTRDWDDLLALLDRQGIRDYAEFCRVYPRIRAWEYPHTHRSLESWFVTGQRAFLEDDFEDLFELQCW